MGSSTSLVTAETNALVAPEAALQESEANLPEEPEAASQESQLVALQEAATDGDWGVLRNSLQDADPTIQSAAFDALAAQDKTVALEELWTNVQDTSQPTRLQAMALLVQSAGADEQTVMAVLRDALQDPDPAFNAYAVQMLAGRDDADAIAALREALHSTDLSTSLMILESVVHTEAGLPLLREALTDADATVRDAAATLLKQAGAVTGTTEKP
jgi:HEAT repeat protein